MFDVGWPELVVILIVALLVIGPRDLPKALYTMGKWLRAARRVTSDFQRHVDDMMRESELDDLRKVANQAKNLNVKKQIENAIDPSGDLRNSFEIDGKVDEAKPAAATKPSDTSNPSKPVARPEAKTAAAAAVRASAAKNSAARKSAGAGPTKTAKATKKVPQRPSRTGGAARKSAAKSADAEKTS